MNKFSIITALLILLSLSACAVQNRNLAGRINGIDISYQDFVSAHRGHFDNFMAEKGRTPDSDEKQQLLRQTWRNITIHIILKNQFKKFNITVSNQELLDTLSKSIPHYLLNSPSFTVNGKFDRNLYLQALQFDTPVNLKPVKEQYYNYVIPIQKLKQRLIDSSMLTKQEYKLISEIVNSSADIKWIVIDPSKVPVSISDIDIQAYYNSHKSDFATIPQISFEYGFLSVKPTNQDSLASQVIADSLYTEIKHGAAFSKLAEQFSSSESSIRGGSLGYVLVMDLPKSTRSAIADLDDGQISEPVQNLNNWTIYQVLDRTKSMIKLNEIVIAPRPSAETINAAKLQIANLGELALNIGMEKAAYEMECDYFRTPVMQKDSLWINDLDVVNKVRLETLNTRPGAILKPIFSQRLAAWIIVKNIQNQTQNYKSLDSVKQDIIPLIERSRRLDVAKQMALRWLSQNKSNPTTGTISDMMQIKNSTNQNINSILFTSPIKDVYYESVSQYVQKQQLNAYELDNMIVIPLVTNVKFQKKYIDNPDLVRSCYAKNLASNWFDKWLEAQIRTANVKKWY